MSDRTVPDCRCPQCNTRLWAYRMTVESTEYFCPYCELKEYETPMFDENMTSELRDQCLDLIIRHSVRLNEILDFGQFRKDYAESMSSAITGVSVEDAWLKAIAEKSALISAIAERIWEYA